MIRSERWIGTHRMRGELCHYSYIYSGPRLSTIKRPSLSARHLVLSLPVVLLYLFLPYLPAFEFLAKTAAYDGVRLWDLRKLKNFRVLSPYNEDTPTNSVEFDHSGSYLTIAGSDVRVYQVGNVRSEWECIKILPDLSGTGKVACVKFGPDAKYLAVGSMDRNLRIFGLPEGDDTAMES